MSPSPHSDRESLFMDYHPEFKDSLPPEPQLREAEWLQKSRAEAEHREEIERRAEYECCEWPLLIKAALIVSVIAAVVLATCGGDPATHAAFGGCLCSLGRDRCNCGLCGDRVPFAPGVIDGPYRKTKPVTLSVWVRVKRWLAARGVML
jgi:hypothetical protein